MNKLTDCNFKNDNVYDLLDKKFIIKGYNILSYKNACLEGFNHNFKTVYKIKEMLEIYIESSDSDIKEIFKICFYDDEHACFCGWRVVHDCHYVIKKIDDYKSMTFKTLNEDLIIKIKQKETYENDNDNENDNDEYPILWLNKDEFTCDWFSYTKHNGDKHYSDGKYNLNKNYFTKII